MKNVTAWFDAKLDSPAYEGWYDCKTCKKRHYFKCGRWYRDQKSLDKDISMYIMNMQWRGLSKEPLTSMLLRYPQNAQRSPEEQAWLNMPPVGAEFGSPDYEEMLREALKEVKAGRTKPYMFG